MEYVSGLPETQLSVKQHILTFVNVQSTVTIATRTN